jgi:ankyrin repeat protein
MVDIYGNTPLHLAAIQNNPSTIELLMVEGASQEVENKEFWKPLDLATSVE